MTDQEIKEWKPENKDLMVNYVNHYFDISLTEPDKQRLMSIFPESLLEECWDVIKSLEGLPKTEDYFKKMEDAQVKFMDEYFYHFMYLERGEFAHYHNNVMKTPEGGEYRWRVKRAKMTERIELMKHSNSILGNRVLDEK